MKIFQDEIIFAVNCFINTKLERDIVLEEKLPHLPIITTVFQSNILFRMKIILPKLNVAIMVRKSSVTIHSRSALNDR